MPNHTNGKIIAHFIARTTLHPILKASSWRGTISAIHETTTVAAISRTIAINLTNRDHCH